MTADLACLYAEEAILGAAMLAPEHAAGIVADLTGDDFSDPRHEDVLGAIRALVDQGVLPDPVAVLGELHRTGTVPATADRGPGNLLADLVAAAPVPASAGSYRRIVAEHSLRRRVVQAAERLTQAADDSPTDTLGQLLADETGALTLLLERCQP